LQFQQGDATTMNFQGQFDILTAARVLQWIAAPAMAISRMKDAAKPGGMLVVLDYNHASNLWDPDPPSAFRQFYAAFLAWRSANQWDNEMAGHLPDLLRHAGLTAVESHLQDEVVERGDPEFSERTAIWLQVIEGVGEQIATAGFSTVSELQSARDAYAGWVRSELRKQTLVLRAVTGRKPDDPFSGA
jgi:SAM-dependent methyltransferase